MKKETAEQLDAFRKRREAVEKALVEENAGAENTAVDAKSPLGEDSWATFSRKRRRRNENDDDTGITKPRKKASTSAGAPQVDLSAAVGISNSLPRRETIQMASNESNRNGNDTGTAKANAETVDLPSIPLPPLHTCPPALGLAAYSSDEE